jgi:hypothetical protein
MPFQGQADYSLVRPLTTGMQRVSDMQSLANASTQNQLGQLQQQEILRNRQIADRDYQAQQKTLEDIRGSVHKNTLEDGTLNENGFIKDMYSINPTLATQIQSAVGKRRNDELQTSEDIDKALDVIAADENLGENSTSYRLLKSVRNNPKLASSVLNDISDINKSFQLIPRNVQNEVAMRQGKVKTSAQTSAASTEAKIKTESALAPISAQTEGLIAGGKAKGARDAGVTLSEASAERLGDFNSSQAQIRTLSEQFSNPDAPQGPIAQLRKLNPYDWEAQAKQQLVAATKQLVGKALEGGVLRAEDEVKYNKILPTIGDTYQAAVKKTKNLQTMLDNAYSAKLTSLKNAGYDVSRFSKSSSNTQQSSYNLSADDQNALNKLFPPKK